MMAAPESHVQGGAVNGAVRASAHVDFKIIIPRTLSLDVGPESHRGQGALMVAITSNNRTVTLGATIHASDVVSGTEARRNVILSAAARRIIAQNAACTPGDAHPAAPAKTPGAATVSTGRVVCTVSTP
jgi:hypothetical protein